MPLVEFIVKIPELFFISGRIGIFGSTKYKLLKYFSNLMSFDLSFLDLDVLLQLTLYF